MGVWREIVWGHREVIVVKREWMMLQVEEVGRLGRCQFPLAP